MTGDNGAREYGWLNLRRIRTANDPDLAATSARLFTEREHHRVLAEQHELAVNALHAELRRQKPLVDAVLDFFDPETGDPSTTALYAMRRAVAQYREPAE